MKKRPRKEKMDDCVATILMKLSEGMASHQYDRWIGILTLWQNKAMMEYIIRELLPRGSRVLDIGCGTGDLLIEAGRRGVRGIGIDTNEAMLVIAQKKSKKMNLGRRVKFELGNALDLNLAKDPFDIVVSTLMVSELQEDEVQKFVQAATNHVKSGGTIIIGGEGEPRGILFARIVNQIRRISYWIVGKLTGLGYHPYHKVAAAMKNAGLTLRYKVQFMGGLLVLYVAEAS
ncbi:MAG: class I SAM-dependent methyltransferase [Candidatus Thorarchaeota archaeon]